MHDTEPSTVMFSGLSQHTKGILLVGAAAVSWSLGGLFFRAIALDPWTTAFWRSAFAALILAGFAAIARWRTLAVAAAGDTRRGLLMSLGIAVSMSTFLPALALTSVANVALIYATAPILAAVLGYLWLGERLDAITVICAVAVVIGGALLFMSSGSRAGLTGDLLALVSTLALVFVALGIRAKPALLLLPYICLANVLVAVVAVPLAPSLAIAGRETVLLALFAFVQVALSFTLFTMGARLLPARETALINALEGPFSPFWVWLAFGERPLAVTIVGGIIIMTAVFGHILVGAHRRSRDRVGYPPPGIALTVREDRTRPR